ncbi:V-set and immunoglobulin domain-containing protein 10 isoform X1 [Entelurus aequoreus]|uniref:V-set and immunoglobulin domain-containing protein 10 isoform X1 n=1 Tax=Entelurus aequoreus TaxID=161455 RepID=UPI002B1D9C03|nr:V-set and immunoglobulin domain-containing protein 10 isoform X1 [Entelurus aequoreus]
MMMTTLRLLGLFVCATGESAVTSRRELFEVTPDLVFSRGSGRRASHGDVRHRLAARHRATSVLRRQPRDAVADRVVEGRAGRVRGRPRQPRRGRQTSRGLAGGRQSGLPVGARGGRRGLPVQRPASGERHVARTRPAEGGPANMSVSINPATVLSNGTLVTYRGSTVSFHCVADSYPSQHLNWTFRGAADVNHLLASSQAPWLDFRMKDVQPAAQGVYSCSANNTVSHNAANRSAQLLVYYVPDRHPECTWVQSQDPTEVHFSCSWEGSYPAPTLQWAEEQGDQGTRRVFASEVTDGLTVALNRSLLLGGQTIKCLAQHLALAPGQERSCSFLLKPPYPEGEPLASAQEGSNVTLTCTESTSAPPANTTWRRGREQVEIVAGAKYFLSVDGPIYRLTIANVSKDDEGVYFCRSENPLAVFELEVYLTVRASLAYTGAVIGVFIAALIVASAIVVAKVVYSNRHRVCLGGAFGRPGDNVGDVLSLVESDDELFNAPAPRLPPLTPANQTTMVQIHHIPSGEQEDTGTTTAQTQEEDQEKLREELPDLVTF